MTDPESRLKALLKLYLKDQISPEESEEFWRLLETNENERVISEELQLLWEQSAKDSTALPDKVWKQKMQALLDETPSASSVTYSKTPLRYFRKWTAIAAALLLLLGISIYFIFKYPTKTEHKISKVQLPQKVQDIKPGGNKAILTLANGAQIVLDSMANGAVAQQGNTKILKLTKGKLAYNTTGEGLENVSYNTLTTPRGGKYEITLPDGSNVWLNTASSIKFPTTFVGNKREVSISGEAYFEIALDRSKPFIVKVGNMKIEVLGTHFDIMAYANEKSAKTTLLEGAVKVNEGNANVLLKPGQQAQVNAKGEIKLISGVDTDKAIAWKNDLFSFDRDNIESVMHKLSRWYDVDVVIQGDIRKHFSGTLPMNVNVSTVFKVLEETGGIHFKVVNKKIIVSP